MLTPPIQNSTNKHKTTMPKLTSTICIYFAFIIGGKRGQKIYVQSIQPHNRNMDIFHRKILIQLQSLGRKLIFQLLLPIKTLRIYLSQMLRVESPKKINNFQLNRCSLETGKGVEGGASEGMINFYGENLRRHVYGVFRWSFWGSVSFWVCNFFRI